MICVNIFGGLGNQMFQYAIARHLACKYETEIVVETSFFYDKSRIGNNTKRSFGLNIFNLPIREVSQSELRIFKPLFLRILNTIFYKFGLSGIQFPRYFIENTFKYNNAITSTVDGCYLSGYWQSFRYFQDIEYILRQDFSFPSLDGNNIKQLASRCKNENSVSIHIRRGDFFNSSNKTHATCSVDYYSQAVDYICGIINDPIFFVFSDDFDEMERQGLEISGWGENVYVKIPITNTKGASTFDVVEKLERQKDPHDCVASVYIAAIL